MSKPRLYLETTIPSYLTAWPSRDPVVAADQEMTKEWWRDQRRLFDLYISEFVWDEISVGDPDAARERMEVMKEIAWLEITDRGRRLTHELMDSKILPEKARQDAAHIAVCAAHGIEYLLTWNCSHIANPEIVKLVRRMCDRHGLRCPEIVTPAQLRELMS